MFVSLFCALRRVAGDVKKWRPAGADRGFTFLHYNLTIAYHRTNLLARYVGQLIVMVASWKILDIKRVTELMLIFRKALGKRLQASMIYSSLTQDTGGGLLQNLTQSSHPCFSLKGVCP